MSQFQQNFSLFHSLLAVKDSEAAGLWKSHNPKAKVLSKIIHTYWTRLLATAMVFAGVVLTSRYLGAEGKGVTSLITTNLLFITLANEFIGGVSLIYLVPRRSLVTLLAPAVLFTLLDSLLLAGFFHLMRIIPEEYSLHLYFLGVLQTLGNTVLYVLLGWEKVKQQNYLFLLKASVNAAFLAVSFMVLKNISVDVFIHALYASNLIPLLMGAVIIAPHLKDFRLGNISAHVHEMLSCGSFAQSANIIQTLNYRLSFYLLNVLSGQKAVGIFSVALAVSDVIWMLSKSIGTVQLTRIANTEDASRAHELTKKFLRFSTFSTLLFLIPAMMLPSKLYAYIFGQEFADVSSVMLMLGAGILIFSVNIILANHFAGTGRYKINMFASLIGLAVNVAANVFLLPRWGVLGAGIAASLTFGATTFYTWMLFVKESSLRWKDLVPGKSDWLKMVEMMRVGE